MEKATVFVANDDLAFLELMQELLHDEGYEVVTLHASDETYREVKRAAPDVVILDMTLEHPDSGWLVLQMLKLDPETTKTPVIVCSADVLLLREREEQIVAMGCYVVEKPFNLETLLSTLSEALAASQQRSRQS